ncbi:hypothetical protein [Hufsiella ginkgonis]|uniref:Tetratricopeptide repeat protein n=1 Tax=Hufsiella ginkgonis TaxID=2695274 RepID=A0A7K1XVP6_9SPHI|nr:hypothetical protein [Hufsiella ginkgonis]MXV15054.1 hypothetical protein [Hufsiella ginkgonis]
MNDLLLVLLRAAPEGKDLATIITPIMSALALILSCAAFIFSVFIQLRERKRNIRQTLSTTLSEIAGINVKVFTLRREEEEKTPELVEVINNYNAQRGTLVSAADFLMEQNSRLASDVDLALMARTYDQLGDTGKANQYWCEAVKRASTPAQNHKQQRDYAAFLFKKNQAEEARRMFEQSLAANFEGRDDELAYLAQTFVLWAGLEKDFDNHADFERLMQEAGAKCQLIKNLKKRKELQEVIDRANGKGK